MRERRSRVTPGAAGRTTHKPASPPPPPPAAASSPPPPSSPLSTLPSAASVPLTTVSKPVGSSPPPEWPSARASLIPASSSASAALCSRRLGTREVGGTNCQGGGGASHWQSPPHQAAPHHSAPHRGHAPQSGALWPPQLTSGVVAAIPDAASGAATALPAPSINAGASTTSSHVCASLERSTAHSAGAYSHPQATSSRPTQRARPKSSVRVVGVVVGSIGERHSVRRLPSTAAEAERPQQLPDAFALSSSAGAATPPLAAAPCGPLESPLGR